MGILSSLFQSGAPVPQVAGPAIATSKLPEELAPYYKDIMGKAQALYNDRTAEGYKPYSGPTMADFTPEQQQAFTGIAGLQGSQAPVFGEAMDLTRSAATPMTQDQLTSYMSPYQQAVTDIEKREATKQYEGQVQPQLAAQAAATGGFGGSRQAILEGMAADTQQRLLGDIQAKGSQSAYKDAVSRFNVDRQAQGQAGAQLATMVPNQFKAQLGELGAIQTVGEQKQKQSQTALDEAFRQYQLERDDPYNTMSKYQSVIQGAPMQQTTFANPSPPTPSTAQTLLGGLGTLVGTYGAFGGKLPNVFGKEEGGVVYAEGGGGLSSLPVVYAANGTEDQTIFDKLTGGFKKITGGVMRAYDKYGNLLGGPEVSDIVKGVKQIGSNIAEKLPKLKQEGDIDLGATMGVADNIISIPKPTDLYSEKSISKMNAIDPGDLRPQDIKPTLSKKEMYPNSGDLQGPLTITQQEQKRMADKQKAIPFNPLQDQARNAATSQIAMDEIDKRMLTTARATEDKEIEAAGKLYLDSVSTRQGKLDERSSGLTDQKNQEQWANVASFFARLGAASPRKGGIMGVVDVALQVAPDTIEAMGKTNAKIKATREDIEDKKMDLETILRKEELGMKISKFELREKRRMQDKIEENADDLLSLEERKLQAEIDATLAIEPAKIADLNGVTKLLNEATGVKISKDGNIIGGVALKGKARAELNLIIQRARAATMTNGLAYYETNLAKGYIDEINELLTRDKKSTASTGGNNEQDQTLVKP